MQRDVQAPLQEDSLPCSPPLLPRQIRLIGNRYMHEQQDKRGKPKIKSIDTIVINGMSEEKGLAATTLVVRPKSTEETQPQAGKVINSDKEEGKCVVDFVL